MKVLIIRWVVLVVSIIAASYLTGFVMKDSIIVDPTPGGIGVLFVGSAVLAIVNATLGKLLKLMTLPLNCMTFGLFALVINAALFWAVGSMGLGFKVNGFLAAFVGSLLVSAISAVLGVFVPDEKKDKD
ncbi:MAG: phage holin family protein [Fimbriimonadaceae bacterium]|nr:MAG: phage holin family protein [Fimbriimonadaceae bacterium]